MDIQKEFQWFLDPLKHHYFDFEGRVTRQTFWMFALWTVGIGLVIGVVSDELAGVFWLVTLLPSLGLGARRLHDIGMSGWMQLIGIIPIIGWIVIIVLLAKQGVTGPNSYGADPRAMATVSPLPTAPAPTPTPVDAERVPPTEQ